MARYFVGSGTNWSSTASWSDSDGGSSGFSVPTSADDVFFTASSPGNCTIDVASNCRSINCTGFTHILAMASGGITLAIGDSTPGASNIALKFVAGMTYTAGGTISFLSTSSTVQAVDFANQTSSGPVNFNGAGGSWQLTGTFNSGGQTVVLTLGTLDTNGQTCSWGQFASNNANTRTLTLGNSLITLNGTGSNQIRSDNLTVTANTAILTFTGTYSGNNTIQPVTSALNLNGASVVFSGAGTPKLLNNNLTVANFTRTGTNVKTDSLILGINTLTVTGTLTITGNSTTNRLLVQSDTVGTSRTLNAAAISLTNVDFQDITGAGLPANAAWTGTSLGDAQGNSNITFDAPVTQTYVGGTNNWSSAAAWTSRVPLPQDDVIINTTTAGTLTGDMPRLGKNVNFTDFTRTFTMSGGGGITNFFFGSLTLSSAMTFGGNISVQLSGRSNYTMTSAGKTMPRAFIVAAPGGTYALQDDLVIPGNTISITSGTFDANGHNVTAVGETTSGAINGTTINMGSGTWNLTGTSQFWVVGTNITVNAQTSTINSTNTTASSKQFSGAGKTYNNLVIAGGGIGAVTFTGANTFANVTIQSPKTVTLTSAITQTITGALTAVADPTKVITINSSTPGSNATIALGSGTWQSAYNTITDITVTGTRRPVLAYHGTLSNTTGITTSTVRPSAVAHSSASTRAVSAARTVASTRTGAS